MADWRAALEDLGFGPEQVGAVAVSLEDGGRGWRGGILESVVGELLRLLEWTAAEDESVWEAAAAATGMSLEEAGGPERLVEALACEVQVLRMDRARERLERQQEQEEDGQDGEQRLEDVLLGMMCEQVGVVSADQGAAGVRAEDRLEAVWAAVRQEKHWVSEQPPLLTEQDLSPEQWVNLDWIGVLSVYAICISNPFITFLGRRCWVSWTRSCRKTTDCEEKCF